MTEIAIVLDTISHLNIELRRIYERNRVKEARFCWKQHPRILPVRMDGEIFFAQWGCTREESRVLPPTGWTWLTTFEGGGWTPWKPELVTIPCLYARTKGVWYETPKGVQALLVPSQEQKGPWVYILCRPASRYFEVMTKSEMQPVEGDEEITNVCYPHQEICLHSGQSQTANHR